MKVIYNNKLKEYSRSLRKNGTLSEAIFWKRISRRQIKGYQFARQKPIGNYIADFYCYKLRLIIEIDGSSHDIKVEYDEKRDLYLNSLGFKVLRINDVDVKRNINGVVNGLISMIEEIEKTTSNHLN